MEPEQGGGGAMTDHDQMLTDFRREVPLPDAETAERIRRAALVLGRPPERAR